MNNVEASPTWEFCARVHAEAYKNGRNEALQSLLAMGRGIDLICSLDRNEDGSLTLESADVEEFRAVLREEDSA